MLAAVMLAACGGGSSGSKLEPGQAVVQRVVDGDTVVVHVGGRDERVRLIGVDTPETVDPRKPVQCFGKEASAHTKSLLPPGTVVRLERDVEPRDRYDRLLAYVYRVSDGLFVNLELARDGYAQQLTIPPNVAYVDQIRAAVADARREGKGLWSSCAAST
ncbi:MAG TPA: thermonuclease family protein [Acidimicrobiales bacterium]|nr:thermonuclease family protein [Acidimicrobiales bacterium]